MAEENGPEEKKLKKKIVGERERVVYLIYSMFKVKCTINACVCVCVLCM